MIGLAVNLEWLREQAAAAGARLVYKSATENGDIRVSFGNLFPAWELALTPPENPKRHDLRGVIR